MLTALASSVGPQGPSTLTEGIVWIEARHQHRLFFYQLPLWSAGQTLGRFSKPGPPLCFGSQLLVYSGLADGYICLFLEICLILEPLVRAAGLWICAHSNPPPLNPSNIKFRLFLSDYPLIYCILASFSLEILWTSDQDTKTKIVLFPSVQQGGGVRGTPPMWTTVS